MDMGRTATNVYSNAIAALFRNFDDVEADPDGMALTILASRDLHTNDFDAHKRGGLYAAKVMSMGKSMRIVVSHRPAIATLVQIMVEGARL